MKTRILFTWLIVAIGSLTSLKANVGQIAADFSVPYFDPTTTYKGSWNLHDQEGSIVILEWFGWWCPFCPPAAEAFEEKVKSVVGSQNNNGVPVKYINLHVEGVDNAQISNYIQRFNLQTVLMDDDRAIFKRFHTAAIQPFFVILNGVKNSPTSTQWEVLYELNGYGGIVFPQAEMLQVIQSVQKGSSTGGGGGGENPGNNPTPPPTTAPALDGVSPFASLIAQNGVKDTNNGMRVDGLGTIYDANYPYVYSFGLAAAQAVPGQEPNEMMGWMYLYPDFTTLNGGTIAYIYATQEWVWFPANQYLRFFSLTHFRAGQGGWRWLINPETLPPAEELGNFLASLTLPVTPPAMTMANPFQLIPSANGMKNAGAVGFGQLGIIDDTAFPIVKSDRVTANQTGEHAGWFYIFPPMSSVSTGLLAYLYNTGEWTWLPANADEWYFNFNHPLQGMSGWKPSAHLNTMKPDAATISAMAEMPVPTMPSPVGAGNPFAGIAPEDGVKDSSALSMIQLGWIDDTQYPFVFSYDLADLWGADAAGWMYFNNSMSVLGGGLFAYVNARQSWHWLPVGLDGLHLNLNPMGGEGILGWSRFHTSGLKPDINRQAMHQSEAIPPMMPMSYDSNPFLGIPMEDGLRNTALAATGDLGFGWIDDSHYPLIYSYQWATAQAALPNAGWFWVATPVSSPSTGVLVYSLAENRWIWAPAYWPGWHLNVGVPHTGVLGWYRFAMKAEINNTVSQ